MRENPGCHRGFCSVVAPRMSPPAAIVDAVREFIGRMLRWAGCEVSGAAAMRHFSAAPGRVMMKRSGICIAALAALSISAAAASAQTKAGVDKLYILNCGEGVAGDI